MKKNESGMDRVIRLVLAVVLILIAMYALSGWLMVLLYILAAVLLITGLTGFCALYDLLGINTNKK